MTKVLTILISFEISISCFSQSILRPDLVFKIDTPFVFAHFKDLLITEKFTNLKGPVYDTIYSLNYGSNNKIKEEATYNLFFDKSIIKYEYDSLNRIKTETQYTISNLNDTFMLTELKKGLFFYNEFDSLSNIEWYKCERNRKKEIVDKEQKSFQTIDELFKSFQRHYNDFTNNWKWSFDSRVDHFYNSKHNRVMTKIKEVGFDPGSKWIFEYDSLNRKIKEINYNFSLRRNFTLDTNLYLINYKKYYCYQSGLEIVIDTDYYFQNIDILKMSLTPKGNVANVKEYWKKIDLSTHPKLDKDTECIKETKYFYDSKDRIKKRAEFSNGFSDTTRFVYTYNK
jgi:hypothetical protein